MRVFWNTRLAYVAAAAFGTNGLKIRLWSGLQSRLKAKMIRRQ